MYDIAVFSGAKPGRGAYHATVLRKTQLQEMSPDVTLLSPGNLDFKRIFCYPFFSAFSFIGLDLFLRIDQRKLKNKSRIYLDTLHLLPLVAHMDSAQITVSNHNYDPVYLMELSKLEKNFLKKWLLYLESKFSKLLIQKYSKIKTIKFVFLTDRDKNQCVNQFFENEVFSTWPLDIKTSHDIIQFKDLKPLTRKFFFLGGSENRPNQAAVHFLNDLNNEQEFDITIFGPNWEEAQAKYPNLRFGGYLENLSELRKHKYIFINPIYHGSGLNMKMVTALELGLPIVTSRFSYDGFKNISCSGDMLIVEENEVIAWRNQLRKL